MNILDFNEHVGMGIETAAALLVSKAPAKGIFNGVPIRAKYATTHPRDIVNEYHWRWTLRDIVYANSPRGKAEGRAREQRRIERQAQVDDLVTSLPIFADPASVVLWIRAMCTAANMVGVKVPAVRIECLFSEYGYVREMCTGMDFDYHDIHTSSCWLVGQFLAQISEPYPLMDSLVMLCDQWLKRWAPDETPPSASQVLHTPRHPRPTLASDGDLTRIFRERADRQGSPRHSRHAPRGREYDGLHVALRGSGAAVDGMPRATFAGMDRTIPIPAHSDRSTTFVLVTSLAQWKRMRQIKAWRAFGRGGMVITAGFAAAPEVVCEMAREAMKGWGRLPGVGWCVVRVDLTAQW